MWKKTIITVLAYIPSFIASPSHASEPTSFSSSGIYSSDAYRSTRSQKDRFYFKAIGFWNKCLTMHSETNSSTGKIEFFPALKDCYGSQLQGSPWQFVTNDQAATTIPARGQFQAVGSIYCVALRNNKVRMSRCRANDESQIWYVYPGRSTSYGYTLRSYWRYGNQAECLRPDPSVRFGLRLERCDKNLDQVDWNVRIQ
ncbi:MAG: hypothetical protein ACOH5I_17465 [Oligoflexus sp.]